MKQQNQLQIILTLDPPRPEVAGPVIFQLAVPPELTSKAFQRVI